MITCLQNSKVLLQILKEYTFIYMGEIIQKWQEASLCAIGTSTVIGQDKNPNEDVWRMKNK